MFPFAGSLTPLEETWEGWMLIVSRPLEAVRRKLRVIAAQHAMSERSRGRISREIELQRFSV